MTDVDSDIEMITYQEIEDWQKGVGALDVQLLVRAVKAMIPVLEVTAEDNSPFGNIARRILKAMRVPGWYGNGSGE